MMNFSELLTLYPQAKKQEANDIHGLSIFESGLQSAFGAEIHIKNYPY
jgi:hypothetical protein